MPVLQAKLCWQNCLLGENGSKPCCQETYRVPESLSSLLSDQALEFEKKPAGLQHSEGYSEVIAQGQQLSPLILQIINEPGVLSILLSEHVLQGSESATFRRRTPEHGLEPFGKLKAGEKREFWHFFSAYL